MVLDRGRVAESWRTARWDSLHLLTPNWMTRLPGWGYAGPDPRRLHDGRRVRRATWSGTPRRFGAPVLAGHASWRSMRSAGRGYRVVTDRGTWRARHVVVATGPGAGRASRRRSQRLDPASTADGRRLPQPGPAAARVACSSSAPRPPASRSPTSWPRPAATSCSPWDGTPACPAATAAWTSSGGWSAPAARRARSTRCATREAARREPSMQLVGRGGPRPSRRARPGHAPGRGVRLAGRLVGATRHRVWFADDLARLGRGGRPPDAPVPRRRRPARRRQPASPPRSGRAMRPAPLSRAAAPDRRRPARARASAPSSSPPATAGPPLAAAAHHRGRRLDPRSTAASPRRPGVYVVGQRFQHRRDSGMIDGARHDAAHVVAHLTAGGQARPVRADALVGLVGLA